MIETTAKIRKGDWIRFQVPDRRVLEGFIQEVSPDETRVRIGKAPESPENQWHSLGEIVVLKTQTINEPT
jgi:hypothetical protein